MRYQDSLQEARPVVRVTLGTTFGWLAYCMAVRRSYPCVWIGARLCPLHMDKLTSDSGSHLRPVAVAEACLSENWRTFGRESLRIAGRHFWCTSSKNRSSVFSQSNSITRVI